MTDDAEAMARAAVDLAATSPLSVDDALRVIAEAARLLDAADIVRDLVAGEAARGGRFCGLCGSYIRSEPHERSCPWRRAVEWTSTQEDQT